MSSIVDLRSDTVTSPSPAMREFMCKAEVGDDVYGEDPTVRKLEELCASLLGKEASLFVPTGTMANQIAIRCHTEPGDGVLAGHKAHTWLYESGAAAAVSGVQFTILPGDGRFTAASIAEAFKDGENVHFTPTRLVTVENTHNMGGGVLWERKALDEVLAASKKLGLHTHLDGARLWNAAVAEGASLSDLAAGFDSVSVCLSKGLGAPVGSLLAANKKLIHKARRFRKMLGGGMRQSGIVAAAGLFALEHNRARLKEDHDNALFLAKALGELPCFSVNQANVQTNIVMIDVESDLNVSKLVNDAAARGVRFGAIHDKRFRLVTHLDVSRSACERAAETIAQLV